MADEKDTNKEETLECSSFGKLGVIVSRISPKDLTFDDPGALVCEDHPGDKPESFSISLKTPTKFKVYIDPVFITKSDGTQIIVEKSDTEKFKELGIDIERIEWHG